MRQECGIMYQTLGMVHVSCCVLYVGGAYMLMCTVCDWCTCYVWMVMYVTCGWNTCVMFCVWVVGTCCYVGTVVGVCCLMNLL